MMHERKSCFNYMAMLPFSCSILCRGMWTANAMNNSLLFKMFGKCLKFTPPPIRLKTFNFQIELSFHTMLKVNEALMDITLKLKWIEPSISSEIINKNHIISICYM